MNYMCASPMFKIVWFLLSCVISCFPPVFLQMGSSILLLFLGVLSDASIFSCQPVRDLFNSLTSCSLFGSADRLHTSFPMWAFRRQYNARGALGGCGPKLACANIVGNLVTFVMHEFHVGVCVSLIQSVVTCCSLMCELLLDISVT